MPTAHIAEDDCPELGPGWRVLTYPRKSGGRSASLSSMTYKIYVAPDLSRYKSLVQARLANDGPSCSACGSGEDRPGNDIVICDGEKMFKCRKAFHQLCLNPPLAAVPEGEWFCPECEHKRQNPEAYPVSEEPKRHRETSAYSRGGHHDDTSWRVETCAAGPIGSYFSANTYVGQAAGKYGYGVQSERPQSAETLGGPNPLAGAADDLDFGGPACYYAEGPEAQPEVGYEWAGAYRRRGKAPLPRATGAPAPSWTSKSLAEFGEAPSMEAQHQQAVVTATARAALEAAAFSPGRDVPVRKRLQNGARPACIKEGCDGFAEAVVDENGGGGNNAAESSSSSSGGGGKVCCTTCGTTWQSAWWHTFLTAPQSERDGWNSQWEAQEDAREREEARLARLVRHVDVDGDGGGDGGSSGGVGAAEGGDGGGGGSAGSPKKKKSAKRKLSKLGGMGGAARGGGGGGGGSAEATAEAIADAMDLGDSHTTIDVSHDEPPSAAAEPKQKKKKKEGTKKGISAADAAATIAASVGASPSKPKGGKGRASKEGEEEGGKGGDDDDGGAEEVMAEREAAEKAAKAAKAAAAAERKANFEDCGQCVFCLDKPKYASR